MNGCTTCGGFGNRHDPIAHDQTPGRCEHDWIERGVPGCEWRECWLCGEVEEQ